MDSRGCPTLEVVCKLLSGAEGRASVPSGASTGIHEVIELRDHDDKRYNGLGVLKAVQNVNSEINEQTKNKDFDQKSLDKLLIELDGTENKARLGANAILGASLSFARAFAVEQGIELYNYLADVASNKSFMLPTPMINVINGGKHADSGLDLQEFMLVPIGFDSFGRKIQAGAEIISALKKIIRDKGFSVSVGDEGGFAPKLQSNEEAITCIEQAIQESGYTFDQIKISIDAAASTFYNDGKYNLKIEGKETNLNSNDIIDWYEGLTNNHPIYSIEDGLAEDDWQGFAQMTARLGNKIKVVGDDLTVTNVKRINTAIENKAINSVLIKLNQIGTLTETLEAIELTKKEGWDPIISHRSGETTDTFIADLSVGLGCSFIKSGSLVRGERVCKYNRLLEIGSIL